MKKRNAGNFSRAAFALCMLLASFVLLEMLMQHVFEATFEVRFREISSADAVMIEKRARDWQGRDGATPVRVRRESSPDVEDRWDVAINTGLRDHGFLKITRIVSSLKPDHYDGPLEISRGPSPLGRLTAFLLSFLLLFLLAKRLWLFP